MSHCFPSFECVSSYLQRPGIDLILIRIRVRCESWIVLILKKASRRGLLISGANNRLTVVFLYEYMQFLRGL